MFETLGGVFDTEEGSSDVKRCGNRRAQASASRIARSFESCFFLRISVDDSAVKPRAAGGAGGGTRTHTTLPSRDFKSRESLFLTFPLVSSCVITL
jgi:hypothetical protein